jgi:hypothetical protein
LTNAHNKANVTMASLAYIQSSPQENYHEVTLDLTFITSMFTYYQYTKT